MTLYTQLAIHFEKKKDHSRTNPDYAWRSGLFSAVGIGGSKKGGLQPHSPLNLNNIEIKFDAKARLTEISVNDLIGHWQ